MFRPMMLSVIAGLLLAAAGCDQAPPPPAANPNAKKPATPETKPEAKPETKANAKPETKPDAKPETKPDVKTDSSGPPKIKKGNTTGGKAKAKPKPDEAKPEEKKPEEKKPDDKKPEEKKPDSPKPEEKKPDAPKPDDKKPEDKKPDAPKPEEKKPDEPKGDKAAKVTLGGSDLVSGIPGDGPLTVEQIKAWLDKPENHQPLEVALPVGLAAAEKNIVIPKDNPLTRAKIELGRQLYFDGRLSANGKVACASCHDPAEGYGKHTQFGVGINDQKGGRNSPISYNRIVSGPQFWDGRAASLEEQAKGPVQNPIEMGNTHEKCVAAVKAIEGYRLQFEKIFGGDSVTMDNIARAIASFERTLVTGTSPADHYEFVRTVEAQYKGDELASLKEDNAKLYERYQAALAGAKGMSDEAKRGRDLFFSNTKTNCTACHAGGNFTDELYHNLGVGMDKEKPDVGRQEVTKQEKDTGAFKTPTLRNVALSAPYMHDGSQKTLDEVVEWYAKGGHPNKFLSDKVKKLDLTSQDKKDLVAYMNSLTGEFPKVNAGRLPQ